MEKNITQLLNLSRDELAEEELYRDLFITELKRTRSQSVEKIWLSQS